MAETGFPISPRLHRLLAAEPYLKTAEPARSYFYQADGAPKAIGMRLQNPAYAQVLRHIAAQGAAAFYSGPLVDNMLQAIRNHPTQPGDLTAADFAAYVVKQRTPVWSTYRGYTVYGMPPPSAGGIAVLQILGVLEPFALSNYSPLAVESVHLFAEAGRLAYADRARYLADSDFVAVPIAGLLDRGYLAARRQRISLYQSLGVTPPGKPGYAESAGLGDDHSPEFSNTSHLTIVDVQGQVLAMTTSIEDVFGSRIMVNGYFMDDLFAEFIPDGMQQERPQLPVLFRIGAFHTDDDHRQRDGDRCGIIGRYEPWVAGWKR
jgi:gamma-glutamyltranspeptidase/glutathione hydrolase